jgi:ubiquitin-like protein Pup
MAAFMTTIGKKRGDAERAVEGLPIYMAAEGGQTQKSKGGDDAGDSGGDGEGGQKLAKKGDELKDEMDALVDEIDAVLEENAEEFVKNYVQRGGQ